jgi:hypothetical protein
MSDTVVIQLIHSLPFRSATLRVRFEVGIDMYMYVSRKRMRSGVSSVYVLNP